MQQRGLLRAGAWILPAFMDECRESSTVASLEVQSFHLSRADHEKMHRECIFLLPVPVRQGQLLCPLSAAFCSWVWVFQLPRVLVMDYPGGRAGDTTGILPGQNYTACDNLPQLKGRKNTWHDFLWNKGIQKPSVIWQSTIHRRDCKAMKGLWWSAVLTGILSYFIKVFSESCEGGWGKSASLMSHNSGNCMKVCVIGAVI